MITVKGHPIDELDKGDSSFRRAQKFKNNIVSNLGRMGVHEDDITIPMERVPIRKASASVSWWMGGDHCFFSFGGCRSFLENLFVLSKVIDSEAFLWDEDEVELEDIAQKYAQPDDIEDQLQVARTLLGLGEHEHDLKTISTAFDEKSATAAGSDFEDLKAAKGLLCEVLDYSDAK